jgi:hypothetical protein
MARKGSQAFRENAAGLVSICKWPVHRNTSVGDVSWTETPPQARPALEVGIQAFRGGDNRPITSEYSLKLDLTSCSGQVSSKCFAFLDASSQIDNILANKVYETS